MADKYLVLYVYPNGQDYNRLGISVSKKVGNAVVRNRITRLIRECFRLHEDKIKNGLDLVFIARRPAKDSSFYIIRDSLLNCLALSKVSKADYRRSD